MPFRFKATKVFLTYSQANAIANTQSLFNFLKNFPLVQKIIVSREEHQDGNFHYHAVVQYSCVWSSRDVRVFDFQGIHPNIRHDIRSLTRCVAYTAKAGDYINEGFDVELDTPMVQLCREAAESLDSVEDAIARVIELGGDRALKCFTQITGYMRILKRTGMLYEPQMEFPGEFVLHDDWSGAVIDFQLLIINPPLGRTPNVKSLWLYGPSRKGKTTIARSLGRHWYMQSMWNATCLDNTAEYGVLDDIAWDSMKFNYKGILGWQKDVTVTDKYRPKFVYKGGIGVVVCTNELPYFSPEEQEWLNENVVFVQVLERAFVLPPARVADGAS